MAQRGGSVVTFVRYGDKVAEPIVEEGCADVLIAFERLEALRYAHYLKKDGVIIANDQRIDPMPVVIGAAEYPQNILEELAKEYAGKLIVAEVNTDENSARAMDYNVTSIPTLLFIKNGEVKYRHTGTLSKAKLEEYANNLLAA